MIPILVRKIFNKVKWNYPASENVIYLTFDDGPIPGITPWVLQELKSYNARATFFCIGDNVRKNPDVYAQIDPEIHAIGNHTMHHLKGWNTTNKSYYNDVEEAEKFIHSALFRPPYGQIRLSQMQHLSRKYNIIMWDVLSKDYDESVDGEYCYQRVIKNAKPGSIIVFHDSIKAEKRLRHVLPKVLKYYSEKGWRFERLVY
jgi:peptidoglycan/xylan/chitin deacetylase (PgdA/CDA1 family)